MNKKVVILILVLVGCFLCLVCTGLAYLGISSIANTITAETSAIKSTNLDYICPTAGNITAGDDVYFTMDFTDTYSYDETVELLDSVFPAGFDCANLLPNGGTDFIGMLTKGQSVSISSINEQTTASITFPSGTSKYTIDFVEIDGDWCIDDIRKV